MKKINTYVFALILAFLIHIYLVTEIVAQNYDFINLWNKLYLPLLFSAISFLFTYIIYTQSGSKSSNYLIYFLLAGSIAFISSSESGLVNLVATIILKFTFPLTGYFFRRFIFEALANKRIIKRQRTETEVFYGCMLLLVIALDISRQFINNDVFIYFSRTLSILYFVLNISLPMIKIIQLLISKQQAQKSFLIWMLFVPTAAFGPFIFLHALPSLVVDEPSIDPYLTTLAFFVIPIGYTYLILTKKLLDLKFVFNRLVYYGGLAFIPSLFLSLILVYMDSYSISRMIQVFVILLVFNIIFFFLKEQFDFYFRHSLFQDKNNTVQFIERIVKDLSKIMNITELENFIVKEINRQFKKVHLTKIKYNSITNQIEKNHLIGNASWDDIALKQLIGNNQETLIQYNGSLGLFLSNHNNTIHYLWLGKQNNNTVFNIREKSWLIIFISYVRLVYENMIMNEKFVKQLIDSKEETSASLSRFLFHFAESERRRLAGDIHDTLLQDQIFIYRKLDEMIVEDSPELLEIKMALKQIIDKTRQTCSEILPNSLSSQGLTSALMERLELFKLKAEFQINYEIDLVDEHFIDYEKTLVIYRVIEELLHNAMKHSAAKRVSIYVWQSEQQLLIDYIDDGKGFNYKEIQNNNQIGLRSMVERIKSVNGIIEFETDKPKHVKIYITIPR